MTGVLPQSPFSNITFPDPSVPPPAAWASLTSTVLTGDMDPLPALEAACVLLRAAGADVATVNLRHPDPAGRDGWTPLGERAWLHQSHSPHSTCRVGPAGDTGTARDAIRNPWLSQCCRDHAGVSVADVTLLPEEAADERADLTDRDVRGFIAAVLRVDGVVFGSIGGMRSDAGPWPADLLAGMALLAAAVGSRLLLARRRDEVADSVAAAAAARDAQNRFLSSVGHEMRTPLAAVIGSLDLLKDEAGEAGIELGDIDVALGASNHLMSVVDDLLTHARLYNGAGEPSSAANVADAVSDALHWSQAGILRRGIAVTAAVPSDADVNVPPTVLRQVLVNLVTNAVNYNHEHGTVRIDAEPVETSRGRRWKILVADDGPGLTEQEALTVFDPFVRCLPHGENTVPGTGLGLALSRSLLSRYDAVIGVRSEPGHGATFWMDLPAS